MISGGGATGECPVSVVGGVETAGKHVGDELHVVVSGRSAAGFAVKTEIVRELLGTVVVVIIVIIAGGVGAK